MIHYLKRFLLLGLLFFSAICLKANRHYIFAFDVAYADRGYINAISSARMVSVVKAILENNSFSKNDYLSFVSYSLNMNSPDFNQFATVAKDSSGKQIKWAQYKNVNETQQHLICLNSQRVVHMYTIISTLEDVENLLYFTPISIFVC